MIEWFKKIIASLLVILSTVFSLCLCEYLLFLDNQSEPYESIKTDLGGISYKLHISAANVFKIEEKLIEPNRILILGDSFVAGEACASSNQNLPSYLQNLFPEYQVINLGVSGKDPADYINFLTHIKITPKDIVLVFLYENDVDISKETCFLSTKQKQSFPVYVPNFCADLLTNKAEIKSLVDSNFIRNFEKYRVFQLLKEGLYNIPVFQSFFHREKLSKRWSNFETEETKWILSTLPIIQKLSERTGGKFHLFYYPNTNRIEVGDIRHFYWQEFITKVFDQYGILLQDPYPYFINIAPRKSMTWSLTDHHPSCDAHGVMAKYVDSIIRKDSD